MSPELEWDRIDLIIYDFDGVMTDNRVLISEDGLEYVFCNRGDGLAISGFRDRGISQVIISTETNRVVLARARKLNIEVIAGVEDKRHIVENYCYERGYNLDKVLYIGNDINDLEAMKIVGFRGAPCDAEKEILYISDWISKKKGGYGVIRELYGTMIAREEYGQ